MSHAYSQIAFTPAVRALQEHFGSRAQYAAMDEIPLANDLLGEREAAFIESRDTLYQATVSETGWPYVQHRGGPAGFIKVLDERTIAYPDFRGNLQYISVGNLSRDDRVSIILLDPAKQRRLKLLGHASLVDIGARPDLFGRLQLDGYGARVERAFVIRIVGFDWNCPQHITPRFTEQEIAAMTAPLRLRVERAERRVAELEHQSPRLTSPARALGNGPLPMVITAVRQLTPRVRSFELQHPAGKDLPAFEAGAHLALPVRLPDGSESVRHYSISSAPDERQRYEVAVLREDGGRGGSRFAHEAWAVGTVLNGTPPVNRFALDPEATHSVLIAGGIGITPLKAMASQLAAQAGSFELHHAARSRKEAAYADPLTTEFGDRYRLYPSGTEARTHFGPLVAAARVPGVHVYVCGPAAMIDALREQVRQIGVPPEQFHSERFSAPAKQPTDAPLEVRLRRSGRVVQVSAQETILEAVEKAGIAVPSSCRTGICRTCAVRVVKGEPDHRDEVLSAAERERDGLMCLCVSRARTPHLEIDW